MHKAKPRSSSGLGHWVLIPKTGVQFSYGVLTTDEGIKIMLEILKTITLYENIIYRTLQVLLLIVISYWLYYRQYVLANPNKSNDDWF